MSDEETTHIEVTVTIEQEDTPNAVDTFTYHFIKTLHVWVVAGLIITIIATIFSL
jgi:hypothetical protein